jgi:hypothetical protein
MAIHDGAGYPLSYCLLSTADSLEIGKRTRALIAWALRLRDKYGINPIFANVDKDMALIGMARFVWAVIKINLCYWHKRKAVGERLAKSKLSTSPYDSKRAHAEFTFIDANWRPPGRPDKKEHEGGTRDDWTPSNAPTQPNPNAVYIRLPAPTPAPTPSAVQNPSNGLSLRPVLRDRINTLDQAQTTTPATSAIASPRNGLTITILPPRQREAEPEEETSESEPEEKDVGRTFCPLDNRQPIIDMMETHYCAHPLIPGYSHPSAEGINYWAVKEMYNYCHVNDLREVWAYLWENWYRTGRWEIWARSAYDEIPTVKTTMVMESQ